MNTSPLSGQRGARPGWTLGYRLRRSLDHADMGMQEMADYLGVSRNTVTNWVHDHIRPSQQSLMLWSMRTGVDYAWLTGRVDPDDGERVTPLGTRDDYGQVTHQYPDWQMVA